MQLEAMYACLREGTKFACLAIAYIVLTGQISQDGCFWVSEACYLLSTEGNSQAWGGSWATMSLLNVS